MVDTAVPRGSGVTSSDSHCGPRREDLCEEDKEKETNVKGS